MSTEREERAVMAFAGMMNVQVSDLMRRRLTNGLRRPDAGLTVQVRTLGLRVVGACSKGLRTGLSTTTYSRFVWRAVQPRLESLEQANCYTEFTAQNSPVSIMLCDMQMDVEAAIAELRSHAPDRHRFAAAMDKLSKHPQKDQMLLLMSKLSRNPELAARLSARSAEASANADTGVPLHRFKMMMLASLGAAKTL